MLRMTLTSTMHNPDIQTNLEPGPCILQAGSVVVSANETHSPGFIRFENGRITHSGPGDGSELDAESRFRYPNHVLIPGLVNAHTHIELTSLRGLARGLPFPDWIARVTSSILSNDLAWFAESAAAGARQLQEGGVTLVGDHSTLGVASKAIADAGLAGVVFQEVFCPDPEGDYTEAFQDLDASLQATRSLGLESVLPGISPHAPYNASPLPLESLLTWFRGYPRSIHACESRDELNYVFGATGVFADRHRDRGISPVPWGVTPVEYLDQHGFWEPGAIAVHATHVTDSDIQLLASRGASVVFCPESNALLEGASPPAARILEAGIPCGIGTDSAISCERLDMFEQMRFLLLSSRLRGEPLTAPQVFHMATEGGARVLGFDDRCTLRPGSVADFNLLDLPGPDAGASPVEQVVWQASHERVAKVFRVGMKAE